MAAKSQIPAPSPRTRAPRSLARYTKNETKRLLKSAQEAGLTVRGLEVDHLTGSLRILVGDPEMPLAAAGKKATAA